MSRLALLPDEEPEPDLITPVQLAKVQAYDAREFMGKVRAGGGLRFPWPDVDRMIGPLLPGWLVMVGGRAKAGKAQPLDATVLMANGSWKAMGDVVVGDEVASVDGAYSVVQGVFPQGERQVYRVEFSDGRWTECCADHLWAVHFLEWVAPRLMSTAEVQVMMAKRHYRKRLWVEPVSGDFGTPGNLPLDPWLLGVLIGDGDLAATPTVSSADAETLDGVRVAALAVGVTVRHRAAYDHRLSGTKGRVNPITAVLREMGLAGLMAHEKFIPAPYLAAARPARLALLQGLLDTDGHVPASGKSVDFCTTSPRLADDVTQLVRSLGGSCTMERRQTRYTYRGVKQDGRPSYRLHVCHADRASLFRLPRKRDRAARAKRLPRLTFQSIAPTRVAPVQCVLVSHPSHLYVTDDYIATHNTTMLMELLTYWTEMRRTVVYVGTETSVALLRYVWGAIRCQVPIDTAIDPRCPADIFERIMRDVEVTQATPEVADFAIFADAQHATVSELALWAGYGEKHGADALIFDHFSRLDVGQGERWQGLGQAIRQIKKLAVEVDLTLVVGAQLTQGEGGSILGEHEVPGNGSWAGSSEIQREMDAGVQLWRPFKPGISAKQKQEAREDIAKVNDLIQQGVMGVRLAAHRWGKAPNQFCKLYVNQGQISNWSPR